MLPPNVLTPKKRAALADCVGGGLLRCAGGYRAPDGSTVHTKRVVNQLERDGLVTVSHFEREVAVTELGRQVAQVSHPHSRAA